MHRHGRFCETIETGSLRPPVLWYVRFYAKVEVRGSDECWPWKPALKSIAEGKDRLHTSTNFSLRTVKDAPKTQMNPARWLWIAEVGDIPEGYDIDHECQVFYCMNLKHFQIVPALVNQGILNKERGVYKNRKRGKDGRYLKGVMPK